MFNIQNRIEIDVGFNTIWIITIYCKIRKINKDIVSDLRNIENQVKKINDKYKNEILPITKIAHFAQSLQEEIPYCYKVKIENKKTTIIYDINTDIDNCYCNKEIK